MRFLPNPVTPGGTTTLTFSTTNVPSGKSYLYDWNNNLVGAVNSGISITAPSSAGTYDFKINAHSADCLGLCGWDGNWYKAKDKTCPSGSVINLGSGCGGCQATLTVSPPGVTVTPTPIPTPTTPPPTVTPIPGCPVTDGNPSTDESPTGVTAVRAGSNINISWIDNAIGETRFRIEYQVDSGSWQLLTTVGANITSTTHTNVSTSSSYRYRVRAEDPTFSPNCYTNWGYSNVVGPVPTATPSPTPTPTGVPSCTISLSPGDLTLDVGSSGPQVASVTTSPSGTTVNRVRFLSLNQAIACVYPVDSCVSLIDDSSSPYSTTVRGIAGGSTQIVGYAYLNPDAFGCRCREVSVVLDEGEVNPIAQCRFILEHGQFGDRGHHSAGEFGGESSVQVCQHVASGVVMGVEVIQVFDE